MRAMQHAQSSTEGQPPHVLPTGPHAPLGREALLPSQVSPRKRPKMTAVDQSKGKRSTPTPEEKERQTGDRQQPSDVSVACQVAS